MVHYKRAETIDELKQILRLQQENLRASLSSEAIKNEGYVTVEHKLELLTEMNNSCPHFIAVSENEVVGYSLCMHPKFGDEIEVLRPMFAEIYRKFPKKDFIVMGQVCIAKEFRGKGIFRALYNHMLRGIQPDFSTIITEVDLENTRSLTAHYAIGFELISEYSSDGHRWALIKLEAR